MWSQRVQYALRTLIALAAQGERRVSARAIAHEFGIPRKYLETILGDLRTSGFIQSTKGKAGGYRLARDPSTIRFSEVVSALEPDWSGSVGTANFSPEGKRPEEPILRSLQERFFRELSVTTVADALMRWQEQHRALNYSI